MRKLTQDERDEFLCVMAEDVLITKMMATTQLLIASPDSKISGDLKALIAKDTERLSRLRERLSPVPEDRRPNLFERLIADDDDDD